MRSYGVDGLQGHIRKVTEKIKYYKYFYNFTISVSSFEEYEHLIYIYVSGRQLEA